MSTPGPATSCTPTQAVRVRAALVSRLADYVELTKPRIAVLAMAAVVVGYLLGSQGESAGLALMHATGGILLVAIGSTVLNQYLERDVDAQMQRTADRPLPSGRLTSREVLLFGLATGLLGVVHLAVFVNALTAGLALITLALYTLVYTPLKRMTPLCTAVGAISGALPPVLGWTAAGGQLDQAAFALFAILFIWQFPHFLAIAWLYREDYERAGLRMLPSRKPLARVTALHALAYALVLIPVSLLPCRFGLAGSASVYSLVALLLGLSYVAGSLRFLWRETPQTARGLIYISLIYLPGLLLVLTWEHFQLLR